jgi:hypothetical protein
MAEWLPPRANPAPAQAHLPPIQTEQLENLIEIATYIALEENGSVSMQQQRDIIYSNICTSLPFLSAHLILAQVNYFHQIFIAKAARAIAVSGLPVAQRLLKPSDPFRLGTDYWDLDTVNAQGQATPTVMTYPDDIVLL